MQNKGKDEAKDKVTINARNSLFPRILLTDKFCNTAITDAAQRGPKTLKKLKCLLNSQGKVKCIQGNSMFRISG